MADTLSGLIFAWIKFRKKQIFGYSCGFNFVDDQFLQQSLNGLYFTGS